ncbi:thioesterase II family protein [Streptosporangium sp. DT93]|uniref:thioesterase II family protein n=1 Tax=Streptosporangium sp. DT93 TaxID=3393428 RepID=UPI003CF23C8E
MREISLDDVWVRRFHEGPDRAPFLVCFPHAGGSANYFSPLSGMLRSSAQVLALQYPGRQDRRHHRCLTTIDAFADEVFAALEPIMKQPVAFFGHSMGAMIAFEVATRMRERLDTEPGVLMVSGRRAPSRHREEPGVHLRDDDGIVAELKGLSGTDTRVLDDPDVLDMILPAVRGDYTAVETYRYRPRPVLGCPIVALTGDEDPKADLDEVEGWRDHTTGAFRMHTFRGGHFYLVEHGKAVADVIARHLP